MQCFCTIITADYFPKAIVLYKSLQEHNKNITLQILIADTNTVTSASRILPGITKTDLTSFATDPFFKSIYEKYAHTDIDSFRWALKPLFLRHLLEKKFNKVIYIDCDIFFTNNFDFLFDELETSSVLLTPHWQTINPLINETAFLSTFTNGIFNAGFIGVNKNGIPALNWWAEACHFKMGAFNSIGIQDDQKYLDIFPVFFEKTKILRHKGCNVAAWNTQECKRTLINGQVLINDEFPVIFIHFNDMLINQILKGHDKLLIPFFDQYTGLFEKEGFSLFTFTKEVKKYAEPSLVIKLKWNLKLRTRLKRFFYRIAESM
jgi:hypothetical protein